MAQAGRRGGPRRLSEAGYSLTELLTVLGILGLFLLVATPNILRYYETALLRNNARGLTAYLKLARMKAVSNNLTYVAIVNPTFRAQCGGAQAAGNPPNAVAVYGIRGTVTTPRVEECYSFDKGIGLELLAVGADNDKVTFRGSGMAKTTAPNWFLIRSRNGKQCQLVCVNAAGVVKANPVQEDALCTTAPYGATTTTPCPPPA